MLARLRPVAPATAAQPAGMRGTDRHPDLLPPREKHVTFGDAVGLLKEVSSNTQEPMREETPEEDGLWEEVKEVSSNTQEPMRKGTINFAWNQRLHYQRVPYFIVPDAWAKDQAFLERVVDGVGLTMPNMIVNFNPIKQPISRWNKAACRPNPPSRRSSLARLASISRLPQSLHLSAPLSSSAFLAPPAYAGYHSVISITSLAQ